VFSVLEAPHRPSRGVRGVPMRSVRAGRNAEDRRSRMNVRSHFDAWRLPNAPPTEAGGVWDSSAVARTRSVVPGTGEQGGVWCQRTGGAGCTFVAGGGSPQSRVVRPFRAAARYYYTIGRPCELLLPPRAPEGSFSVCLLQGMRHLCQPPTSTDGRGKCDVRVHVSYAASRARARRAAPPAHAAAAAAAAAAEAAAAAAAAAAYHVLHTDQPHPTPPPLP
jgi:hypothetical protein